MSLFVIILLGGLFAIGFTFIKLINGASKAIQGPTGRKVAGSLVEQFLRNMLG